MLSHINSGTTCVVANFLGRKWIGFDINPEYIAMSEKRIKKEMNMLDSFDPREKRTPKNLKKDSCLAFHLSHFEK